MATICITQTHTMPIRPIFISSDGYAHGSIGVFVSVGHSRSCTHPWKLVCHQVGHTHTSPWLLNMGMQRQRFTCFMCWEEMRALCELLFLITLYVAPKYGLMNNMLTETYLVGSKIVNHICTKLWVTNRISLIRLMAPLPKWLKDLA